ncbi:MAG TPA: class I SAM-dependent methyltransferase [Rhodanobacter sp.]|nr:class I SAM-dependent methyltransferase [Rhodanobacter sp.]
MGFFDQYPRFYATSQTSPLPHRLNGRHEAIITRNADQLIGKRVLDIASHDGRWSFAALQAGASHVIGIEPRAELIDNANQTFEYYGIDPAYHEFRCGDVFDRIDDIKVDIVLCLGFYYHTIRHAELLDKIERTGAQLVIIDTEVTPWQDSSSTTNTNDPRIVYGNPYLIQLLRDPVDNQQMAATDSMTRDGHTLVGRPSRAAVEFMAHHYGYSSELHDWRSHLEQHPERASSMVDYAEGWRDTFYLVK